MARLRSSSVRPNKRLKLAGGDRFKGSGVLCAGAHELSFKDGCALGRSRPQLKRGPLGAHHNEGDRGHCLDGLPIVIGLVMQIGRAHV